MSQNSPSRRSSISSISSMNSRNSFFNSPSGSPLRLSNLATTPSPIRRLRNLNPSPPNQRRRRRRTIRNSPNRRNPNYYNFNNPSLSPVPSYNFNLNNATVNNRNLYNILRNLNNTPPPSPLRFRRSGPANAAENLPIRHLRFNNVNNLQPGNKARRSTNEESYMSRANLERLRRGKELIYQGKRAPHNIARNFNKTIPLAAAQQVVNPVNIQRARPLIHLENYYVPEAVATSYEIPNNVFNGKNLNKFKNIVNKRKQRKTKKLEKNLKKIFSRKRSGGTKKRGRKSKKR